VRDEDSAACREREGRGESEAVSEQ